MSYKNNTCPYFIKIGISDVLEEMILTFYKYKEYKEKRYIKTVGEMFADLNEMIASREKADFQLVDSSLFSVDTDVHLAGEVS
jgi:hypothetical protein